MLNLSLTACSFYLKKVNERKNAYYLNKDIKIDLNKKTIVTNVKEMFNEFLITYQIPRDNDEKMKTFHCEYDETFQGETEAYQYFYTIIRSGNYGSSSDVIDNATKKIVYKISPNQTPEKQFILFVAIPKDNKEVKVQKGILIFQNVGAFGIKTITTEYINDFFTEKYGIKLICKSIAPKLFIEKMITKDSLNKIIMTRNDKSADRADNLFLGYGKETRILANLSLNNNAWISLYERIKFFSNKRSNLFEFNKIDYEVLKLEVKIGEKIRTINMNNLDNLSIIQDIPSKIMMSDGLPNKDMLIEHFISVTDDYLGEMVLQFC